MNQIDHNKKDIKEKILKACQKTGGDSIPKENLLKYVESGVVSLPELKNAGLNEDRELFLASRLEENEIALWRDTVMKDTCDAYKHYIEASQFHYHDEEARGRIKELDEIKWSEIQDNLSDQSLSDYLVKFPDGNHVDECQALLADLPWLETKRKNTIDAYETYMENNPGKHIAEARAAILAIKDDNEWENACALGTTSAYRDYLTRYPKGRHMDEAQSRLNSGAAGEQFLLALKHDPNAYMAYDIQQKVGNGVIAWSELENIFGYDKAFAIRNFQLPTQLPNAIAPESLQSDTTEVYFWGTPSSGKTCALGTIISSAKRKGILEPLQCEGLHYLNLLSNIFQGNNICTLPDSTQMDNIQEMVMNLYDEKKKPHKITLIDLAGELFRTVYKNDNGLLVDPQAQAALEKAINYLKDRRNNKIHFFVVEYDAHDKKWDGLSMSNYLIHMIQFLKNEKVFTKSTVGVYVLVTKCDKMECSISERPLLANEYVKQNLADFWNILEIACKNAAIKDLKTLSFSIGDVFAQQLCAFNGADTNKVIDKLLTKTPAIKRYIDWLRN